MRLKITLLVLLFVALLTAGAAIDPLDEKFAKVEKVLFRSHEQMMQLQKEFPRLCLINKDGVKWIIYDFFDILPQDVQSQLEGLTPQIS